MKTKKKLALIIIIVLVLSVFSGCSKPNTDSQTGIPSNTNSEQSSGGTITISYWTGTEQFYVDFWTAIAEKYNAENNQLDGKTIKVEVQMAPMQPSGEASIQNAIATNSAPTISENITRSFASVLADADCIYELSGQDWYNEIVAERSLGDVLTGWALGGKQYVIPLYVNPMVFQYNAIALKAMGVTEVPKTLADFDNLLSAYDTNKGDLANIGITHFMYRHELTRPDFWWERWFDFESPYKAIAGGKNFVEDNNLTIDRNAAKQVFDMYGKMGNSLLIGEIPGVWQESTVPVVMGVGLPWEIKTNRAAGKSYGMDGDYVFGPTFVKNSSDKAYCYADSKGIVLYKTANISDEQHRAACEFLKWVFTGPNKDTFDSDWMDATSMLPVRGDLDSNPSIKSYLASYPELQALGPFVPNAVPCMNNEFMPEILTALGEDGLMPFITDVSTKVDINQNPDSSKYVDDGIKAMAAAGSLIE